MLNCFQYSESAINWCKNDSFVSFLYTGVLVFITEANFDEAKGIEKKDMGRYV